MENLKAMKQCLMACAQGQMTHLDQVDAKELGEVIDMIKDLEEAMYYCTITKAMEGKEKEWGDHSRHTSIYYSEPMYSDGRMMYGNGGGRMYYDGGRSYYAQSGNGSSSSNGGGTNSNSNGGRNGFSEDWMRDPREGSSPQQRRMYMESKQMHHGKAKQLQELEKYMKELSNDLIEMVEDASPEERQYLSNRMSTLATKIQKLEND